MRKNLHQLSLALQNLHKELLLFQCRHAEELDEKLYGPYERLQLSIQDSRFEWLKKLSSLITQIDLCLHSEEEIEILDLQDIYDKAQSLIKKEDFDFSRTYQLALQTDPHLYFHQSEVKEALKELEPEIRNLHEMHKQNEKEKFENQL